MIKSQLGDMALGRNDYIWGLLSFFLFFFFLTVSNTQFFSVSIPYQKKNLTFPSL